MPRFIRPLVGMFCLIVALPAFAARPNVLFITVDDMNFDSVGAFGCELEGITPNIDRLAGEGQCFDRGFVTIAICQPTRAVWMTGRYPHRSGAMGFDKINKDVPSLPEALQAGGYYTALLAKLPHVVPSRADSFDLRVGQNELGRARDKSAYVASLRKAMSEAKDVDKPWFVMANLHDPHRPFAGSDQERWRPRPKFPRTFSPDEVPMPGFLPDLPEIRLEISEYFASVHRADDIVGGILKALDEAGQRDNTLVLFMSDHGMALPFAKTNCYYASNRTPWIVRWPGVTEAGSRDNTHFVSGIDVAPTILDAVGLDNLAGTDGASIVPLLKGDKQPERDHVFTMHNYPYNRTPFPMRAVQDADYLYIWNGWANGPKKFSNESQSGRTMKAMAKAAKTDEAIAKRVKLFLHRTTEELYDLRTDPDCLHNLIEQQSDEYSPRASAMTKRLWHWMKETDDPQRELFEKQVELALD